MDQPDIVAARLERHHAEAKQVAADLDAISHAFRSLRSAIEREGYMVIWHTATGNYSVMKLQPATSASQ